MREIKFRAWDNRGKQWVTDYDTGNYSSIEFVNGKYKARQIELIDALVNGEHEQYEDWIELEDIEVMQSTGLQDKNGVDIYQGDICKIHYLVQCL